MLRRASDRLWHTCRQDTHARKSAAAAVSGSSMCVRSEDTHLSIPAWCMGLSVWEWRTTEDNTPHGWGKARAEHHLGPHTTGKNSRGLLYIFSDERQSSSLSVTTEELHGRVVCRTLFFVFLFYMISPVPTCGRRDTRKARQSMCKTVARRPNPLPPLPTLSTKSSRLSLTHATPQDSKRSQQRCPTWATGTNERHSQLRQMEDDRQTGRPSPVGRAARIRQQR